MKGKNHFTKEEAQIIEQLIEEKLSANAPQQKGIRAKIRRLGFYASDFNLSSGYTVLDFRRAVIINKAPKHIPRTSKPTKLKSQKTNSSLKSKSDEAYLIDLCDEVLQLKSLRQHRFEFLRGDTGVKLPVDALNLVIEYYERQHSESVSFFDKRITSTGISRGEQRKRYDELRQTVLPNHGVKLVIFDYSEFGNASNKRLLRNREVDLEIIKYKLNKFLKNES